MSTARLRAVLLVTSSVHYIANYSHTHTFIIELGPVCDSQEVILLALIILTDHVRGDLIFPGAEILQRSWHVIG